MAFVADSATKISEIQSLREYEHLSRSESFLKESHNFLPSSSDPTVMMSSVPLIYLKLAWSLSELILCFLQILMSKFVDWSPQGKGVNAFSKRRMTLQSWYHQFLPNKSKLISKYGHHNVCGKVLTEFVLALAKKEL